jgi:hypothetical protein
MKFKTNKNQHQQNFNRQLSHKNQELIFNDEKFENEKRIKSNLININKIIE